MPKINFDAKPYAIHSWTIIHLPKAASAGLPSRGMVMVQGTLQGEPLQTALEPDGRGSHWFTVPAELVQKGIVAVGRSVTLEIEPLKEWLEPDIPEDIRRALDADNTALQVWDSITPMARWDWLRWIRATLQPETRNRRIEVALSKMRSGERRPCCFNRTMCTEASVAKNGVLLEPSEAPA